jgi:hypothetical protein
MHAHGKLLIYKNGHKCNQLWPFLTFFKAVRVKIVIESFKNLSLSGFLWLFVTFLNFILIILYVLNRLTYINCCRTNNYYWWSNIASLINFGSNSMPHKWQFLRNSLELFKAKMVTKRLFKCSQKVS